jgi:hypothetical protein
MSHYDGINALIGIIPIPDQYDVNNNGEEIAMYELINPVIVQNPMNMIRSWTLSHLRVSIVEEVVLA